MTGRSADRVFFGWKVVATAFAVAVFSWGIGFGVLRDVTGDYAFAFSVAAAFLAAGVIVLAGRGCSTTCQAEADSPNG